MYSRCSGPHSHLSRLSKKELNLFFFGLDQSCVNVKIVIERFIKDLPSLFIARS